MTAERSLVEGPREGIRRDRKVLRQRAGGNCARGGLPAGTCSPGVASLKLHHDRGLGVEDCRMPKTAVHLTVDHEDAATLRRWARSTSVRAGLATRARIVLLAAAGHTNTEIAARVGCSGQVVVRWRGRDACHGLDGLANQPRSGRPPTIERDVSGACSSQRRTQRPCRAGGGTKLSSERRRAAHRGLNAALMAVGSCLGSLVWLVALTHRGDTE